MTKRATDKLKLYNPPIMNIITTTFFKTQNKYMNLKIYISEGTEK
jgi:hypothetical protein